MARLPGGRRIHGLLQEWGGELSRLESSSRFENAEQFLRTARQWCGEPGHLKCVELGTGWVPAVPLALLLAGARVDTFDVTRLCRPRLYRRTRDELGRRAERIATAAGIPVSSLAERLAGIASVPDLATACETLGGSYCAPFDTGRLPHDDGGVDLVLTNLALQCIPQSILPAVLQESYRVLRPGGFAIHRIRMTDEYEAHDPQRNHLQYLSFPRETWDRWFNHPLKHQNRLRASQFLDLFAKAGFECRCADRIIDEESLPIIRDMDLAEEFAVLDPRDVATVHLDVVLQKPKTTNREQARKAVDRQTRQAASQSG